MALKKKPCPELSLIYRKDWKFFVRLLKYTLEYSNLTEFVHELGITIPEMKKMYKEHTEKITSINVTWKKEK